MSQETRSSRARTEYTNWKDYFMANAFLAAEQSRFPINKDICTKGACIVNKDLRLVGFGHSGLPNRCESTKLDGKNVNANFYVCHAILNAIMDKNSADLKNCSLYADSFPCNECAKKIIQSGLSKVYYANDNEHLPENFIVHITRMLDEGGVSVMKYEPTCPEIDITLRTATQDNRDPSPSYYPSSKKLKVKE